MRTGRPIPELILTETERETLQGWARRPKSAQALALRARMILRGAEGATNPEKLLRALLLQVLYTIRSERQLMEQLDYNMLYRWFVGLNMDDSIWNVTVFTKNR